MRTLILLDPHDHARLTADYLLAHPISRELDLIEATTYGLEAYGIFSYCAPFFFLIKFLTTENSKSIISRSGSVSMELPTIVGILAIIKFLYDMTKEVRSAPFFKKI